MKPTFRLLSTATVTSLLLLTAGMSSAEAAWHGPGSGPGHMGHGGWHGRGGYGIAFDDVYVGEGCGYYLHRARETGLRYWWSRYNECRYY